MTLAEFKETLKDAVPPPMAPALVALWRDAKGDWDGAHTIAQDVPDPVGALVHAYLHRKEGDQSNAAYWYRRAGRTVAKDSLEDEWARIVAELLAG